MASASRLHSDPTGGELYLTVSFLIERERLREQNLYTPFARAKDHPDLRNIESAMKPMFDDIADRERHIFFDEHLIDTKLVAGNADNRLGNSGTTITVEVPRTIKWRAEDQSWQYDAGASWEWKNITCRFFWLIHSNRDVSYHISLQAHYEHDAQHYYALSLLQKLFFPSETPDENLNDPPSSLNVIFRKSEHNATGVRKKLSHFLAAEFSRHVRELPGNTVPEPDTGWWAELVLAKSPNSKGRPPEPTFSRAALLLKDRLFDKTLRHPAKAMEDLRDSLSPKSQEQPRNPASLQGTTPSYRNVDVGGLSEEAFALIFLSGFLQNIIDFLEQDELEYQDAIEPLYPAAGVENDPHFLLYATQHSIFEVVASSRSLARGSDYIGICPYLFLVHLTVFHDESLVKRFEDSVRDLIIDIEERTTDFDKATPEELDEIVFTFNRGRFGIFGEVERYLHINTFLYSTEQAFYKAISKDRYIEGRLNHWDRLLKELSSATTGAHELARQKTERRINKILLYIAMFSVFQVLFAGTQSLRSWEFLDMTNHYSLAANILDVLFVIGALILFRFAIKDYLGPRSRRNSKTKTRNAASRSAAAQSRE